MDGITLDLNGKEVYINHKVVVKRRLYLSG